MLGQPCEFYLSALRPGWRAAFYLPGAAGLLWAAAWALMAQSTPAQPDEGHIVVPPRPARCVLQLHRILASDRKF